MSINKVFGSSIDVLGSSEKPKGITTVATTLTNGPLVVPMEIHSGGCGIFEGEYDPLNCTCGYYFPIVIAL